MSDSRQSFHSTWLDTACDSKTLMSENGMIQLLMKSKVPIPEKGDVSDDSYMQYPMMSISVSDLTDVYLSPRAHEITSKEVSELVSSFSIAHPVTKRTYQYENDLRELVFESLVTVVASRSSSRGSQAAEESLMNEPASRPIVWKTISVANADELASRDFLTGASITISIAGIIGLPQSNRQVAIEYMCTSLLAIFGLAVQEQETRSRR